MKWWELADKLVTDYQDGGSRTTPEKRTIPAEWLQKQGPFGTKMPAAPGQEGRAEAPRRRLAAGRSSGAQPEDLDHHRHRALHVLDVDVLVGRVLVPGADADDGHLDARGCCRSTRR